MTINLTNNKGNFVHAVHFWLKEPGNEKVRATFEASLSNFVNNSVFIKTRHLGSPASTDRPIIDKSYTYTLIVTFENKEMHDAYQIEEGHLQFIKECNGFWDKVLIYDSVSIL
jgi:hypothetical protein